MVHGEHGPGAASVDLLVVGQGEGGGRCQGAHGADGVHEHIARAQGFELLGGVALGVVAVGRGIDAGMVFEGAGQVGAWAIGGGFGAPLFERPGWYRELRAGAFETPQGILKARRCLQNPGGHSISKVKVSELVRIPKSALRS